MKKVKETKKRKKHTKEVVYYHLFTIMNNLQSPKKLTTRGYFYYRINGFMRFNLFLYGGYANFIGIFVFLCIIDFAWVNNS